MGRNIQSTQSTQWVVPILTGQEFCYPSAGISVIAGRDFHPDFPSKEYHARGHLQTTPKSFLLEVFRKGFVHSIIAQRFVANGERDAQKVSWLSPLRQAADVQLTVVASFFGELVCVSPLIQKLAVMYLREKVAQEKTGKFNRQLSGILLVLTFTVNLVYSVFWTDKDSVERGRRLIREPYAKTIQGDPVIFSVQAIKNAYYTDRMIGMHEGKRTQSIDLRQFNVRQLLYLLFPKLELVSSRKVIRVHGKTDLIEPGDAFEKKFLLRLFQDVILYDTSAVQAVMRRHVQRE